MTKYHLRKRLVARISMRSLRVGAASIRLDGDADGLRLMAQRRKREAAEPSASALTNATQDISAAARRSWTVVTGQWP